VALVTERSRSATLVSDVAQHDLVDGGSAVDAAGVSYEQAPNAIGSYGPT
jgi:hypothetical protein